MKESIGSWDNGDRPSISPHKWTGEPQPEITLDAIREMFRQEIQLSSQHSQAKSEIPPYDLFNRSHIGVWVRITDFDGQEYEGVLYPTKVEK